jgi:hypothetical protein
MPPNQPVPDAAHTLNAIRWPETADGAQSAIVCDGCHASTDEIQMNGHRWGCDLRGRHQHHVDQPINDCIYYLEWRRNAR